LASATDISRRRGFVLFADHHQHRCRHVFQLVHHVERRQIVAGGLEHIEVGGKERGAAFRDQFGMGRLEVRREQPAHGDVGDGLKAFGGGAPRHVAEGFAAGFGKSGAAVGKDQPAGDAGMPHAICRTTKPP